MTAKIIKFVPPRPRREPLDRLAFWVALLLPMSEKKRLCTVHDARCHGALSAADEADLLLCWRKTERGLA